MPDTAAQLHQTHRDIQVIPVIKAVPVQLEHHRNIQ